MMISVDAQELRNILDMTPCEQNVMLAGGHGIGKSQILTRYFEEKGLPVIAFFLGQMSDPGDLIGLPYKDEKTGKTDFLPPYWFPTDDQPVVLFLDELNRARPEILQSVMDLTLNRKLAGKSLPEGSYLISAVNFGEEYQLTDLDPALVSRFNIYHFRPSVGEWLLWAEKKGLDARVIKFIEKNAHLLDGKRREDADNLEKTPDRRGWERVSNILKKKPAIDDTLKKAIAGIIGAETTNIFFQSLQLHHQVDGYDVLNDFPNVKKELEKYSLPELSAVSESLLRYLETNAPAGDDLTRFAGNVNAYVSWITSQPIREAAAHFTELYQKGMYPKATAFILINAPLVLEMLNAFILEL